MTATQPLLGVPGTIAVQDVSKSATRPVQGLGTSDVATQPLQDPGTATQPPQVLPTGNDATQLDQSLPGVQTDDIAGESDSEAELDRELASPASVNAQGELPEDPTDQDLSEELQRDYQRGQIFHGLASDPWHQCLFLPG